MSIQQENIVFVETEVMDDVPEGGGAATGRVIVDGRMNNLFDDVSDIARASGQFNLRKICVGVGTATTDKFSGARTCVTGLPDDPALSYTIFSTHDPFDRREAAAEKVGSYLFLGNELPGYLIGDYIIGQKSIQLFQRPGTAPPEAGQTLVLKNGTTEQYVLTSSVESELRQETYSTGSGFVEYDAVYVTIELVTKLAYAFKGSPPTRTFTRGSSGTALRDVVVANATNYYGAVRLSKDAHIGEQDCRAESIFTRLVPAAQTSIPLVDKPLVGDSLPLVAASAGTVTTARTGSMAPGGKYVLPTGCWPGSLSLTIASLVFTDDGLGNVMRAGVVRGSISYRTGEIFWNASASAASGAITESYRPAASVSQQSYTMARDVTEASRSDSWVVPIFPLPSPATLAVSYMSQGKWYELRDNGLGQLSGTDAGYGSGSMSYVTGTTQTTLGALPDVGSKILYSWGTHQELLLLTEAGLQVTAPVIEFDFGEAASPGSIVFTWMSGGIAKHATDNGAGTLGGDAAGSVIYGGGKGWLRPTALPDVGSLSAVYQTGASGVYGAVAAAGTGWSGTIPDAPHAPGSIVIDVQLAQTVTNSSGSGQAVATRNVVAATITDNGVGGLLLSGALLPGASFNYETGDLVLAVNVEHYEPVQQYEEVGGGPNSLVRKVLSGYINEGVTRTLAAGGISVRYRQAGQVPVSGNYAVAIPGLSLDLTPLLAGTIAAGSLMFRLGGMTYVERSGALYHSIDPLTGAGTPAGSINYATGKALLTVWASGSPAFDLLAGLINPGTPGQSSVLGRTASRPLKSQSMAVTATTLEGDLITAISQADGTFSGAKVRGTIDIDTGIYDLSWGETIAGAWSPILVDVSTLRYNGVAYRYLPLDPDILGIDAVRLPPDGRVAIFRPGDLAQIMHTATTTGTPALDGGVYKLACGRTRVAWVKVTDANGGIVTDGYTLDRDTGVLSWKMIAGLATPVTVRHTVSDLRLVSDAQITGFISFAGAPLTHDYPAGESIVSSCLFHGDLKARVSLVFDQQTWSGIYADSVSGSAASATLNTITYPIRVTNEGAETERWSLKFITSTTAELHGEHFGMVWSGSFTPGGPDIAPINPRTLDADGGGGSPYLVIPGAANGGGWASNNVVRINTVGVNADFWIARAIQQSAEPVGDGADGCELHCLGNIDRP